MENNIKLGSFLLNLHLNLIHLMMLWYLATHQKHPISCSSQKTLKLPNLAKSRNLFPTSPFWMPPFINPCVFLVMHLNHLLNHPKDYQVPLLPLVRSSSYPLVLDGFAGKIITFPANLVNMPTLIEAHTTIQSSMDQIFAWLCSTHIGISFHTSLV